MPLTEYIARSLAPGIGLTSVMFYSQQLQNRMIYITGRLRDLNGEARELRARPQEESGEVADRMASVRKQIEMLLRRAMMIRRTLLTAYLALMFFVFTIISLLTLAVFEVRTLDVIPVTTFAVGFLCMALAAIQSIREMFLSLRTIREDTRSSLGEK